MIPCRGPPRRTDPPYCLVSIDQSPSFPATDVNMFDPLWSMIHYVSDDHGQWWWTRPGGKHLGFNKPTISIYIISKRVLTRIAPEMCLEYPQTDISGKETIISINRVILWAKVRKISINRPGKKSKGINQKWCRWPPYNICIENYIWLHFTAQWSRCQLELEIHFTGLKITIAIKYTAC